MPNLRRLSGSAVIGAREGFGFTIHAQVGSHVKLRRIGSQGQKQTLTIPRHRELDTGTLRAIFRQAGRYVPDEELRLHFFTD